MKLLSLAERKLDTSDLSVRPSNDGYDIWNMLFPIHNLTNVQLLGGNCMVRSVVDNTFIGPAVATQLFTAFVSAFDVFCLPSKLTVVRPTLLGAANAI